MYPGDQVSLMNPTARTAHPAEETSAPTKARAPAKRIVAFPAKGQPASAGNNREFLEVPDIFLPAVFAADVHIEETPGQLRARRFHPHLTTAADMATEKPCRDRF